VGAELTTVGEHVAVEFPGVVRDLDVGRGQAAVVLPGSARIHTLAPLRRGFPRPYYYEAKSGLRRPGAALFERIRRAISWLLVVKGESWRVGRDGR
jgi:hypothetical protein